MSEDDTVELIGGPKNKVKPLKVEVKLKKVGLVNKKGEKSDFVAGIEIEEFEQFLLWKQKTAQQ